MGVMQKLRDNTHIILWTTLILFVLGMTIGGLIRGANLVDIFSGESKNRNLAGSVNGQELKSRQFVNMVQNRVSQMRESGQTINNRMYSAIADRVWNQYVNEVLLGEIIEKYDLKTTGDEIYHYLRTNPPQFIRSAPAFQNEEGEFDYQKYLQRLNNPQGNEWYPVEQQIRGTLPYQKLNNLIQGLVTIPEWEIREQFIKENVKMEFETLTLPYSLVSSDCFNVSSSEIREYYKNHKDEYHVPETREIKYVNFPIKPSKSDTQLTREQAVDLKQRIEQGENFKTVATEYSEDTGTKDQGGDLDWFTENEMVPKFSEAAFNASPGEIVGPVLTRYGYHLIKVEDRRQQDGKTQVKARHILLKITAGPETESDVESQANLFAFDANELGFEAAADSNNYTIQESPELTEDTKFIRQIGYFPEAARFAFSTNSIGKISDVYKTNNAYVICKLTDIKKEHYTKLAEVKSQIKSKIIQEKRLKKLEAMARELYQNNPGLSSLDKFADQNDKYKYKHYGFKTLSSITSLESKNNIQSVLLEIEPGKISRPVKSGNNYVLIKLDRRTDLDQESYQEQRTQIKQELLKEKRNQFYTNWLAALKEQADIFDNHTRFY
ncbi:MAG: peptidylprolyl isomerase [Candidatus Marinimicrobia bacterium]|nr:peptidylprolyl isomerase [Candidatus Neomarinimicrobiota bacterium]